MSAPQSGLILCQNTLANTDDAYFLKKGEPIVEPLSIESVDGSTTAVLYVDGADAGAYQGAINIAPGANALSATPGAGITIRTTAGPGTTVEIGANAQGPNILYIAGPNDVSQVNDGIYNPTIKSTAIFDETFTLDSSAPATAVHQIPFTITRAGAYMLQIDINFANADSVPQVIIPVYNPINPSSVIGAYDSAGGALEWTITAPEVQYMSSTITATSLIKANALDGVADPMDFSISNMGFLNAGAYQFNMYALKPVAGPNASGNWILSSVKARVIQMC